MKAIRRFTVRAVLPEELSALDELAGNLRWSWYEPTRRVFAHVSPELWEGTGHDPVALLGAVDQERLRELAADEGFVAWAEEQRADLRAYCDQPRWYQSLEGDVPEAVGYFSPEFGIAAALPQYSGGLGILAGDHLKSASDLGVPLVGVGLFYRSGYFRQGISSDGWQQETYPVFDPDGLPLQVLRDADGAYVRVTLALPGDRMLHARIWQARVGRIPLLLLDTDVPENDDDLRRVTDRLYGGGGEHRLHQELLLGIGGVRAIAAHARLTGSPVPRVFHTNEGHAGFLGLERISALMSDGLDFDEALQVVRAGTVFTTHTPVPAGIDRFDVQLVRAHVTDALLPGVPRDRVLELGAEAHDGGDPGVFNMALMGLRLAQRANGVSRLHGEVSRGMFAGLWPGFDTEEVPITSVTNGVHAPTWTDPMLMSLAGERLGTTDTTTADWSSPAVTDGDLWDVRGRMRRQLVADARRRVVRAWREQDPGGVQPTWLDDVLDPEVLTIGFARRVPTYKRLTLMLHDRERLRRILTHPERPVQIVVAGKSHPADDEGKRLIQELVRFASEPGIRGRLVFLPDYDIGMAQLLYPGTDVWLNNPLRPLEACGTSGMKAALNGALNLSILDGWWDEYSDGANGWAIPSADRAHDGAERDAMEATALYDLIEDRIAPRFYDRDADGVPAGWVHDIRHTLRTLSPELSADRMVRQYVERLYVPAGRAQRIVAADDHARARELAAWRRRIVAAWPSVQVAHVESEGVGPQAQVGDELRIRAWVALGGLDADDVAVEVVHGRPGAGDALTDVVRQALAPVGASGGQREFAGTVRLASAGPFGYTVRVVPRHELLASSAEPGLVAVAS